jgi:hypothetical protein
MCTWNCTLSALMQTGWRRWSWAGSPLAGRDRARLALGWLDAIKQGWLEIIELGWLRLAGRDRAGLALQWLEAIKLASSPLIGRDRARLAFGGLQMIDKDRLVTSIKIVCTSVSIANKESNREREREVS